MLNVDDISLFRVWNQVTDEAPASLTASPNPAKDQIQITSDRTVESYEVFTLTGSRVFSDKADASTFTVELGDLPAGVYLITVNYQDEKRTLRLVKE